MDLLLGIFIGFIFGAGPFVIANLFFAKDEPDEHEKYPGEQ